MCISLSLSLCLCLSGSVSGINLCLPSLSSSLFLSLSLSCSLLRSPLSPLCLFPLSLSRASQTAASRHHVHQDREDGRRARSDSAASRCARSQFADRVRHCADCGRSDGIATERNGISTEWQVKRGEERRGDSLAYCNPALETNESANSKPLSLSPNRLRSRLHLRCQQVLGEQRQRQRRRQQRQRHSDCKRDGEFVP